MRTQGRTDIVHCLSIFYGDGVLETKQQTTATLTEIHSMQDVYYDKVYVRPLAIIPPFRKEAKQ